MKSADIIKKKRIPTLKNSADGEMARVSVCMKTFACIDRELSALFSISGGSVTVGLDVISDGSVTVGVVSGVSVTVGLDVLPEVLVTLVTVKNY